MEELDEAVESSPSLEGESDGEGVLLRRGDGVWLLLLCLSCISLLKGGEGDLLLCFACAWNALLFVEEEKVQHFVHARKIPLLFLKEWEETYGYESNKIFLLHFFHFLKRNGNLKRYAVT